MLRESSFCPDGSRCGAWDVPGPSGGDLACPLKNRAVALRSGRTYHSASAISSARAAIDRPVLAARVSQPLTAASRPPLNLPRLLRLLQRRQDFVSRLLEKNPNTRMTAHEAIIHPWLSLGGKSLDSNDLGQSLKQMMLYNAKRKLRIAVRLVSRDGMTCRVMFEVYPRESVRSRDF